MTSRTMTRSGRRILCGQAGLALAGLIVAFLLMAALAAVVVSLSSTTEMTVVSGNQGLNAYYLAEAGYRYASGRYLMTQNENDDSSADDDKAAFLENELDGKTFTLPENKGSFTVSVYPYWLISPAKQINASRVTFKFPGQVPPGFAFPPDGTLRRGNDPGAGLMPYQGVPAQNGNRFEFVLKKPVPLIEYGDPAYLVLYPTKKQRIEDQGDLRLSATGASSVPPKNGMIQVGNDPTHYRYRQAVFDETKGVLSLKGIYDPLAQGPFSAFKVKKNTEVVFKKFIRLTSVGRVGTGPLGASRTVDYYIPIQDGLQDPRPDEYSLTEMKDVKKNFTWDNKELNVAVHKLRVAGGGKATFTVMNKLKKEKDGYKQGNIWFDRKDKIDQNWRSNQHYLGYDVQVKMGTGNKLRYAALGLSFRVKDAGSGQEANLGISFMKYQLPRLRFRQTGKTALSGCMPVKGESSGATAVVHGTTKKVEGEESPLREAALSQVSGNFEKGENLLSGGSVIARVESFEPFNDFIPDAIKPGCLEDKHDRTLMVLWEKQADGTLRWLAYKDLAHDAYVVGNQDCPGTCYDGQIVNDLASLLMRVRETHVQGTGQSRLKVNDIQVFYGDTSEIYKSGAHTRTPDNLAYDILRLRQRYRVWTQLPPPHKAIWPPKKLRYWDINNDYFTHLENPDIDGKPQVQFQWDGLNPDATGLEVFELLNDGTVRVSDLTTPDAGTYQQAEVGMHSFGDITTKPYRTAAFADFSLKFYFEGYPYGGFLDAVQE